MSNIKNILIKTPVKNNINSNQKLIVKKSIQNNDFFNIKHNNKIQNINSKSQNLNTYKKNRKYKLSNKLVNKKNKKKIRLITRTLKDIKNNVETKKKLYRNLMNMSKKQLKDNLIKKGLLKNNKVPLYILRDIYLNPELIENINIIS